MDEVAAREWEHALLQNTMDKELNELNKRLEQKEVLHLGLGLCILFPCTWFDIVRQRIVLIQMVYTFSWPTKIVFIISTAFLWNSNSGSCICESLNIGHIWANISFPYYNHDALLFSICHDAYGIWRWVNLQPTLRSQRNKTKIRVTRPLGRFLMIYLGLCGAFFF